MTTKDNVKISKGLPDFPTIESFVGNTPLVKLQRLPGNSTNIILGKLEGNNPAGSVKDRPALSMIKHAEMRGEIKPGDKEEEHNREQGGFRSHRVSGKNAARPKIECAGPDAVWYSRVSTCWPRRAA